MVDQRKQLTSSQSDFHNLILWSLWLPRDASRGCACPPRRSWHCSIEPRLLSVSVSPSTTASFTLLLHLADSSSVLGRNQGDLSVVGNFVGKIGGHTRRLSTSRDLR